MMFTGRVADQDGKTDWLKCEHCGHETAQPQGFKPIPDVVCRKCGKKQGDA